MQIMYKFMYVHIALSFCTLCRYHAQDDGHLGLDVHYPSNAPSPYLAPHNKNLKGLCKEHI